MPLSGDFVRSNGIVTAKIREFRSGHINWAFTLSSFNNLASAFSDNPTSLGSKIRIALQLLISPVSAFEKFKKTIAMKTAQITTEGFLFDKFIFFISVGILLPMSKIEKF
jgi:hypothetical protein